MTLVFLVVIVLLCVAGLCHIADHIDSVLKGWKERYGKEN